MPLAVTHWCSDWRYLIILKIANITGYFLVSFYKNNLMNWKCYLLTKIYQWESTQHSKQFLVFTGESYTMKNKQDYTSDDRWPSASLKGCTQHLEIIEKKIIWQLNFVAHHHCPALVPRCLQNKACSNWLPTQARGSHNLWQQLLWNLCQFDIREKVTEMLNSRNYFLQEHQK